MKKTEAKRFASQDIIINTSNTERVVQPKSPNGKSYFSEETVNVIHMETEKENGKVFMNCSYCGAKIPATKSSANLHFLILHKNIKENNLEILFTPKPDQELKQEEDPKNNNIIRKLRRPQYFLNLKLLCFFYE